MGHARMACGMFGLYRIGGQTALIFAACFIITASFFLAYRQCSERPHLAVFAVLLGAFASTMTWGARPQMLSMLLTALLLYLLYLIRHTKRSLWWTLPVLTAVWSNMHGGYFICYVAIGAVIIGDLLAHLADQRTAATLDRRNLRNLSISLGMSIAAAGMNPNGYRILWYPFETLGSRAMQEYIQEWASPNFHQPEYWSTIALLFAGALVLILSRRQRDISDMLLFGGFSLMALLSIRHIPLFSVVSVPIVTRYASSIEFGKLRWDLSRPPDFRPPRRALVILNWLLVLVFLAASVQRLAGVLKENQIEEARHFPVNAVNFIQQQGLVEKRIYNSYNWGGYLLWRGIRVFIDGRADVYLDDFINEYMLAYMIRNRWRVPLDKFAVDYVLIERDGPLSILLREIPEWQKLYEDDLAIILMRTR